MQSFVFAAQVIISSIDRFLNPFLDDYATELSSCSGMNAMANIVDKGKAMPWAMYVLLKY